MGVYKEKPEDYHDDSIIDKMVNAIKYKPESTRGAIFRRNYYIFNKWRLEGKTPVEIAVELFLDTNHVRQIIRKWCHAYNNIKAGIDPVTAMLMGRKKANYIKDATYIHPLMLIGVISGGGIQSTSITKTVNAMLNARLVDPDENIVEICKQLIEIKPNDFLKSKGCGEKGLFFLYKMQKTAKLYLKNAIDGDEVD